MYTKDTILTFTKYSRTKLSDVPVEFLVKFYKDNFHNTDFRHRKLIEYIEKENICSPPKPKECTDIDGKIGFKPTAKGGALMCTVANKIIFPSEKDAKYEINRIQKLKEKGKTPSRTYYCESCGGWHLTSKSLNYTL
jgi:uncharacterized protein (DUF3820 family)